MPTLRLLPAVVSGLVLALVLGATPASARSGRQVLLVVIAERSYEQVLADPLLSDLASAGGIGLMTSSGGADLAARTAVSLGAGRSATDARAGRVPVAEEGSGLVVDLEPYLEAAGDAVPGLLGSALAEAGAAVGYLDLWSGGSDVAVLAAMDRAGLVPSALLDASLADSEAASRIVAEADLVVSSDPEMIGFALERTDAAEVLVVVAGVGASQEMLERGDTVAPIVVARGAPEGLLLGDGEPTGLTSSTTRREGIVSDVDVPPTILSFLGLPTPSGMTGSPIRSSGAPPTELHTRYLDHQRVVGPVGQVLVWPAIGSLVAGLAAVFVLRRPSSSLIASTRLVMLLSVALLVAMVAASVLRPSGAVVAGGLGAVAMVVTAIALRLGRRDPRAAVAAVAVAGLVVVVADAAWGWPSGLTPLVGGGALDGERFFGLGNAYAGLVLAGSVLGAARLPARSGIALIAAGSVFAGLPALGADLGGSVTLAIAAALWFGLRRWRRLGWRAWAVVAAAGLIALALVTIADRVFPGGGTHVSGVAVGGGEAAGQLETFLRRLGANVRTTSQTPAAWLAVLGLPIWLSAALRRPRRLEPTLGPDERWRDAVVVLALGGIAGYLLNDTQGMAGVTFGFLSAAMLYPTLAAPAERRIPTGAPGAAASPT